MTRGEWAAVLIGWCIAIVAVALIGIVTGMGSP